MKKIVCLLLVAILSLLLCACGGDNVSNNQNGASENKEDKVSSFHIDDSGFICVSNLEEFCKEYVVRVEITKDNWKEYFGDYFEATHIVDKNDFGDVTNEYDQINAGFTLKDNIIALYDQVSFKFNGLISYDSAWRSYDHYVIFRVGEETALYKYPTNEFIQYLGEGTIVDCCLVEVDMHKSYGSDYGVNVGDFECIDVIGTIYVVNLPKEVYSGEGMPLIVDAKSGVEIDVKLVKEHFGDQ